MDISLVLASGLPALTIAQRCLASPLAGPYVIRSIRDANWAVLVFVFVVSTLTEFLVITCLAPIADGRRGGIARVCLGTLLINAITYPITQILALVLAVYVEYAPGKFWRPWYNWYNLVQLLPFVAEYYMLRWLFGIVAVSHAIAGEPVYSPMILSPGELGLPGRSMPPFP